MAILTVGAGKNFARLSDAIAASRDGDVLQVQAGTYTNDFANVNAKITIEGVGGMVKLVATVAPPNAKGILVTNTDLTIRNFEFTGAAVRDANGAGIRHQAGNLVVENCYFHDNQEHILTNNESTITVTILRSEFANHNPPDGQAHSIYAGRIGKLEIRDSYFHDGTNGNMIKSRAAETIITGSRIYDNDSPVSYSIDLPNGGKATILNNTIMQGPNSPNRYIISYGTESAPMAGSSLLIQDNVIENFGGNGYAVLNRTALDVAFTGNKLYQMTRVVDGPSTQLGTIVLTAPVSLDRSAPWAAPVVVPPPETGLVLVGTDGNDVLAGGATSDSLSGGLGNDTLTGGGGHDRLDGGGGNDVLNGGTGDDVIVGGDGIDTITYVGLTAGVQVNLALSGAQNTGGGGIDTISGVERLTGGSGSDLLTGNEGGNVLSGALGNDSLIGSGGADTLIGGAGDDWIDGGTGNDTASYAGTVAAVSVNLTLIGAQNTGGAGFDTLISIENLVGGDGNDLLTGNGSTNLISGGSGNDTLRGGGGTDYLDGGAGDDVLLGDAGRDLLIGGLGADRFRVEALSDSGVGAQRDLLRDFSRAQGDLIDISALDADVSATGDQAFSLIGSAAFSGMAGQLRFVSTAQATIVQGDINGDRIADFEIEISGSLVLLDRDFVF